MSDLKWPFDETWPLSQIVYIYFWIKCSTVTVFRDIVPHSVTRSNMKKFDWSWSIFKHNLIKKIKKLWKTCKFPLALSEGLGGRRPLPTRNLLENLKKKRHVIKKPKWLNCDTTVQSAQSLSFS